MKPYNGTAGLFILDTLLIATPIIFDGKVLYLAWILGLLSIVSVIVYISSPDAREKARKEKENWSQFFTHYDIATDILFLLSWGFYGWYWVVGTYLMSMITLKWIRHES